MVFASNFGCLWFVAGQYANLLVATAADLQFTVKARSIKHLRLLDWVQSCARTRVCVAVECTIVPLSSITWVKMGQVLQILGLEIKGIDSSLFVHINHRTCCQLR